MLSLIFAVKSAASKRPDTLARLAAAYGFGDGQSELFQGLGDLVFGVGPSIKKS